MHSRMIAALGAMAAARGAAAVPVSANTSFSFLVMADWGGDGKAPFTTKPEITTAGGMSKVAAQMGSKFALAVGDNFYSSGIKTDCHDARFKNTFEDVFTQPNLQAPDFDFKVIAGNHDHGGNVTAQIAYSALSPRWTYPESWYSFTKDVGTSGRTMEVLMIDTVILSGNSDVRDERTGEVLKELRGSELPGPEDEARASAQMQWVETTLKASTADYLFVAGHFPVWSVCEHGPTPSLVTGLRPLLEQYHVNAYLAGHDHCMELVDDGRGVAYHGMGSAHENDPSTAHSSKVPQGSLKFHTKGKSGGFGSFQYSSDGETLIVRHHEGDGSVAFTAPALRPRNKVPSPSPPPGPPAPPQPPSDGYSCYANSELKKGFATNTDIKTPTPLTACYGQCNKTSGCKAVVWHGTDKHCHIISGAFEKAEFVAALTKTDPEEKYTACIQSSAATTPQ